VQPDLRKWKPVGGRSLRFIDEENVLTVRDQLPTKVRPYPARATFDMYSLLEPGPLLGGWNCRSGKCLCVGHSESPSFRVCISIKSHERNNLVYWVSCALEARSTMNEADPRSSIVFPLASADAARTACSSSAMASWPSVCPRGTSRTPAVVRLAI